MKNLYLFVGPSGAGKTSVVDRLELEFNCKQVRSYTERPRRFDGENCHTFVTSKGFDALIGVIAPTTIRGYRYGVTQEMIRSCDFYVIEPTGVLDLRRRLLYRSIKVIGISAPYETLKRRMQKRGDSTENMLHRLEIDKGHFEGILDVCDVVFQNDDLEVTVRGVAAYINCMEIT